MHYITALLISARWNAASASCAVSTATPSCSASGMPSDAGCERELACTVGSLVRQMAVKEQGG